MVWGGLNFLSGLLTWSRFWAQLIGSTGGIWAINCHMDKSEAHMILAEQLARFSSYAELVPLVDSGRVQNLEVRGTTGAKYQVEVQFFWDDNQRRSVRVVGSIDDGGIRAFVPLTQTLLIHPPENLRK